MSRTAAIILVVSCAFLVFACANQSDSAREKEIRVRLIEFETIRNNDGLLYT